MSMLTIKEVLFFGRYLIAGFFLQSGVRISNRQSQRTPKDVEKYPRIS